LNNLIFEQFIYFKLRPMIDTDLKLSSDQFGFRQRRSTVDALALMEYRICVGFDQCHSNGRDLVKVDSAGAPKKSTLTKVAGVFFDMKRAFDKVPHGPLLHCLKDEFAIPDNLIVLLQDFLADRELQVRVGSELSSVKKIKSSVPQGSALSGLLFIAYINKVAKVKLSPGASLLLYADDILLSKPLLTPGDVELLNRDVQCVADAISDLHLTLNESKTKFMVFSLKPEQVPKINLTLNGSPIECVTTYKYLGITLDRSLNYSQHIQMVCEKVRQGIGCMNRTVRKFVAPGVLDRIYRTVFYPRLTYAAEIVFPYRFSRPPNLRAAPNMDHNARLYERTHRRAAQSVTNNYLRQTQYSELLHQANWRPVTEDVWGRRLQLLQKYQTGTRFLPADILIPAPPARSLRNPTNQYAVKTTLSVKKNTKMTNSYFSQASNIWNKLPNDKCSSSQSLKSFVSSNNFTDFLTSNDIRLPRV